MLYNTYWNYKLHKIGFTNKSDRFLYSFTQAWWVEKKVFEVNREANMKSLYHMEDKVQR